MPEVQSLPILDALSESTSKIFRPLFLQEGECILLGLSEDAKSFEVELVNLVRPYKSQTESANYAPVLLNGEERIRGPYGISYTTKMEFLDRLPEKRW